MPTDFDYSQLPATYDLCLHDECPQANQCLRYFLAQGVPPERVHIEIISPAAARKAASQGTCCYFRPIQTHRFGQGIEQLLKQVEQLPYNAARATRNAIYGYFGKNKFYRIRHGERLVYPEEQQRIAAIFRQAGIQEEPHYDRYVDRYDLR